MQTIIIIGILFVGLLLAFSHYTTNGVGSLGAPLKDVGNWLLKKAPAGAVDLFEEKDGSGGRTWIGIGLLWFIAGAIGGFLQIFHNYDPSALDSLASLGWSYEDGSGLARYTTGTLQAGVLSVLIGGALIGLAKSHSTKLGSEANASLMALLFTALTLAGLLIPSFGKLFGLDADLIQTLTLVVGDVLVYTLVGGSLIVNILVTTADRGDSPIAPTGRFALLSIVIMTHAPLAVLWGEISGNTHVMFFADVALKTWVPIGLMFANLYYIIPSATGRPIWSGSLTTVSILLLFVTVPPFYAQSIESTYTLENLAAILMTISLIPILATSANLLSTAGKNFSGVASNPGATAGVIALLLMPVFAIGAYFGSMDVMIGSGDLAEMSASITNSFMFTIGGLVALAAAYHSYPVAAKKEIFNPGSARMSTTLVAVGGFFSAIALTMSALGDLVVIDALNSLQNLGQTDKESALALATGQLGTFDLVGAFMFYGVPIGAIMALNSVVRTGFSGADSSSLDDVKSDISSYNLNEGVTSIRHLLSRGVGLDTELVIGDAGSASGGSTVIGVSATLHDDEVTEFPEDNEHPEELVQLAQYLADEGKSIFEFFKSIDLDDSGSIDGFELQRALKESNIANLPPWDLSRLIKAVDINGDGDIDLPELDIKLALIRTELDIQVSESKVEESVSEPEAEAEESDEEAEAEEETAEEAEPSINTDVEVPSISVLNKMKKDELVSLAEEIGIDSEGTKKDLVTRLAKLKA